MSATTLLGLPAFAPAVEPCFLGPHGFFLHLGPTPSSNFWSGAGNCWCPTCQEAFPLPSLVFAGLGLELGSGRFPSEAQPSPRLQESEGTLCQVSPVPYPSPVSRAPQVPGPWPLPHPHHISGPSVPFPPACCGWGPRWLQVSSKSKCVCLFALGLISERGGELRGVTPLFPEP